MARSTQYIGLNAKGNAFVKDKTEVIASQNQTVGMFDEPVPLGEWEGGRYIEKEQMSPWSSGPMIFTAIWDTKRNAWVEMTKWQNSSEDMGFTEDRDEHGEFNYTTGQVFV